MGGPVPAFEGLDRCAMLGRDGGNFVRMWRAAVFVGNVPAMLLSPPIFFAAAARGATLSLSGRVNLGSCRNRCGLAGSGCMETDESRGFVLKEGATEPIT